MVVLDLPTHYEMEQVKLVVVAELVAQQEVGVQELVALVVAEMVQLQVQVLQEQQTQAVAVVLLHKIKVKMVTLAAQALSSSVTKHPHQHQHTPMQQAERHLNMI
jgi:hypothetical protein